MWKQKQDGFDFTGTCTKANIFNISWAMFNLTIAEKEKETPSALLWETQWYLGPTLWNQNDIKL